MQFDQMNSGIKPGMLSDPPTGQKQNGAPAERRASMVRLFLIRNGRLVEFERRERPLNARIEAQEKPAKPLKPG